MKPVRGRILQVCFIAGDVWVKVHHDKAIPEDLIHQLESAISITPVKKPSVSKSRVISCIYDEPMPKV